MIQPKQFTFFVFVCNILHNYILTTVEIHLVPAIRFDFQCKERLWIEKGEHTSNEGRQMHFIYLSIGKN